jgi:hypothetical protein
MGRSEIDAWPGGANRLIPLGGQDQEATVTSAEPGKDGAVMALEYLLEGRPGATTVLRLVQSGALAGDWETEYEAMRGGWPLDLHTLAEYLAHFAPRVATPVTAFHPGAGDPDALWHALGVTEQHRVGDAVQLSVPGARGAGGMVDAIDLRAYVGVVPTMRSTPSSTPGLSAAAGHARVTCSLHTAKRRTPNLRGRPGLPLRSAGYELAVDIEATVP